MKMLVWKKIARIILIEVFSISQFSWGRMLQDNSPLASNYNSVSSAPIDTIFETPDAGAYGNITLRLAESDPVTSVSTVSSVLSDFNIASSGTGIDADIIAQTALDVSMADDATMTITFGKPPDSMSASHDVQGFIVCRPTEDGGALQVVTVVKKGKLSDFFSGDKLSEIELTNSLSPDQIVSRINSVLGGKVVYSYPKQIEDQTGKESLSDIPLITRDFLDSIISQEIEQLTNNAAATKKINLASNGGNPGTEPLTDSNLSAYLTTLHNIQSLIRTGNDPSQIRKGINDLKTLTQKYIQAKLNTLEGGLQDSFGYINGSLVAAPFEDIWLSDESSLTKENKIAIIKEWMQEFPVNYPIPLSPDYGQAVEDQLNEFLNSLQDPENPQFPNFESIEKFLNDMDSYFTIFDISDGREGLSASDIDTLNTAEDTVRWLINNLSNFYDPEKGEARDDATTTTGYFKSFKDWTDLSTGQSLEDILTTITNLIPKIEKVVEERYIPLEIYKKWANGDKNGAFQALESSSTDEINTIFSSLKIYADSILAPQYKNAVIKFKNNVKSYQDLIANAEAFNTSGNPPGEMLAALEELNNISQGLAASKLLLSQAILLDQSIDNLLPVKSSALGAAVMGVVDPIAESVANDIFFGRFFDYKSKNIPAIKDELKGYQAQMRKLIYDTFNDLNGDNLTKAMTQLGLLQPGNGSQDKPLIKKINTAVNNLIDANKRNDVAGLATEQLIQFVALSIISGAVGSVIRSTKTFLRIADMFKDLKNGSGLAKVLYWGTKIVMGGAIIGLNVIDNMQESSLALMGRPGALIASLLFPGSKLAALAFRMGLNGVVVGLSTGLANYYQGTTLGKAAAFVGNPFIALNWVTGNQNSWINNLIQPLGIPLPDIAEFLHLIVYGTDRLPLPFRKVTVNTVEMTPVIAAEGGGWTSPLSSEALGIIAKFPEPIQRGIDALVSRLRPSSSSPATTTDDTTASETEPVVTTTAENPVATTDDTTAPKTEPVVTTTAENPDETTKYTYETPSSNEGSSKPLDVVNSCLNGLNSESTVEPPKPITEFSSGQLDKFVDNLKEGNPKVNLDTDAIKTMLTTVQQEMQNAASDKDSVWTKAYRAGIKYLTGKLGKKSYPHIYQLISAYLMAEGKEVVGSDKAFLNVFTGQGKTVSILMANLALSEERGGPVITLSSHAALIERDVAELSTYYENEGKTFATFNKDGKLVDAGGTELADQDLNNVDIIYAEASAPVFYILRQWARGNYKTWDGLKNASLVLDEVDAVLIEQALSPFIISETRNKGEFYSGEAANFFAQVGKYARKEIELPELLGVSAQEWNSHVTDGTLEGWVKNKIKEIIPDSIKKEEIPSDINQLADVVMMAPEILDSYAGQYIVDKVDGKNQVIILSDFSDEPQVGKHWMGWIHQLIETAKGLPVSKNTNTTQALTMQAFVNQCGFVTGASGTAYVFDDLFKQLYSGDTVTVPKSFPDIRNDHIFGYTDQAQKVNDMFSAALESARRGNSVLLTTSRENVAGFLQRFAGEEGVTVQKYDASDWLNETKRKSIEAEAAKSGRITVTTQILGRGMNIVGSNPLTVIADRLFSQWSSDQIVGRAYRGGSSGASFTFFSIPETAQELERKAGVPVPSALLDGLNIVDEGTEFDLNDPRIIEIQRKYLSTYLNNIQKLAAKYRVFIDFEKQSADEGAPQYYLRPLNDDPLTLYKQFPQDMAGYTVGGLKDKINNSSLLSQSVKDKLLNPLKSLSDSTKIGTIFSSIESYLDTGPQNARNENFLRDRFSQKYIKFYKSLVFSNMNHPDYQGEGGASALIDDSYSLFKIDTVLDLYALAKASGK